MAADTPHWTETADRIGAVRRLDRNPLVGLVGETENGTLLLPSWFERRQGFDGWWGRKLNLRNPLHWFPYLRSRRAGVLVWLVAS